MNILVSSCLLGIPCRFDGQSKPCEAVRRLAGRHRLIPVCPEVLGGLSTPREPSEIRPDGRVYSRTGQDVSEAYLAGAREALRIARLHGCSLAILKASLMASTKSSFLLTKKLCFVIGKVTPVMHTS